MHACTLAVLTWMTQWQPRSPAMVILACPVGQRTLLPATTGSASLALCSARPPALLTAPSTPPPPRQPSLAAFTIAAPR